MSKFSNEELSLALFHDQYDYDADRKQAITEIRQTREKLGGFSLGYFMEAIYGDEYASQMRQYLGEDVYNMRMSDVKLETNRTQDGITTKLSKELLEKIERKNIPREQKKQLTQKLDEHLDTIEFDHLVEALSHMSESERDALMKLASRMGKKRLT